MGKVIARIDRPFVAGARVMGVKDAVKHGIAQVDIARRHVDPGAQHARAVRELARFHAAKQIEVFLHRSVAERAVLPGLGQRATCQADLFLRLVVDISETSTDQAFRPIVESFSK